MNSLLRSMLPDPLPNTPIGMINAMRETMQSLALMGLWRAKFFEHARQEVAPFIDDVRALEIWNKDFFKAAAERIEVVSP